MRWRNLLVPFLTYLILLKCNGSGGSKPITGEDIQLKRQLQSLNKSAVKIIKWRRAKEPLTDTGLPNIWLNGKGCPDGTVPIKRITKEELIKVNKFVKLYLSPVHELTEAEPGVHYAVLRTKNNTNTKYRGGGMDASLHRPKVKAFQYSASQLKIQGGTDYIQAGWMVNPNLSFKNHTKLFIFTHTNRVNCFNMLCFDHTGFVQTRPDIPVDFDFEPLPPGQSTSFHIYKDFEYGDWTFELGLKRVKIGYWPHRLFTGLKNLATNLEWGGKVYSPTGIPSPPMGRGRLTHTIDTRYSASCYKIYTIDENHQRVIARNVESYMNNSTAYMVYDSGVTFSKFEHLMYYGGDGGIIGN